MASARNSLVLILQPLLLGGALSACLIAVAGAQDITPNADSLSGDVFPKRPYSPPAGRNCPTNVYWGDTHVHTS